MRATVVAGLGGLVIGHVLWLIAISLAFASTSINFWVLVVALVSIGVAAVAGVLGWMSYRANATAKAAFLWCLPATPLLLSLVVLGVTYL